VSTSTPQPAELARDREARQRETHNHWLADEANRQRCVGLVVILFQDEVLGSGPDHLAPMQNARRCAADGKVPFPDLDALARVVVPDELFVSLEEGPASSA
jgi:hypothetical protein